MKSKYFVAFLLFFSPFFLHTSVVDAYSSLTAEEVWNKIRTTNTILLVDVRTSQGYTEGHIPTAINIPFDGTVSDDIIDLIDSKDKPELIAYCSCVEGSTAKNFVEELESTIDFSLTLYYMKDDFRYWPFEIVAGSNPGTIPTSPQNNTDNGNSNNHANEDSLEPLFLINIFLVFCVIIGLAIRKAK